MQTEAEPIVVPVLLRLDSRQGVCAFVSTNTRDIRTMHACSAYVRHLQVADEGSLLDRVKPLLLADVLALVGDDLQVPELKGLGQHLQTCTNKNSV